MCSIGLYTATDQPVAAIRAAAERLSGIDLLVRSGSDLDDPTAIEAFVDRLEGCDVVVCWLHGSESRLPDLESVREQLRRAGVDVVVARSGTDGSGGEGSTVEPAVQRRVRRYLEQGGVLNVANLCRYLASEFGEGTRAYDDPVALPSTGVYHPDHPGATVETLAETFDSGRPTVGIWFYESHWTAENTRYVDALVRALEAEGVDAFPVFTTPRAADPDRRDAAWVATNFCSDGTDVRVDAILTTFMYSLTMTDRGRSAAEPADPTVGFLETLDVPVVQAMTTMRPRAAYRADDAGLPPFELALSVALPELDGTIVSHPISGKERVDPADQPEGIDGTAPHVHRPIEGRVEHAAELTANWARLGRTPPAEKRIAVVLHNYPPSDDGIGTAFGLDTPASLDRLLDHLDAAGYRITDRPADGGAIVEELVGQLTADVRWTDPDDSDGIETVDPATYREWFEALHPDLQAAVCDEWGDPPTEPIAIPGVALGNVLVTVQPPRGFEVDPERVYHDSALQPPHEYVAAYRWLAEGLDADAVVHLGTHGSLEWLPGKTVGLDGASAPDGLLDSIPNVYPYVINNPGEGTQATRRSYATIVDHLTPPMRAAGTDDDLAELEGVVREYRERARDGATGTGLASLEAQIRERVRAKDLGPDLGIEDIDAVDTEDLVVQLHGYLTDVSTTQIRMGLHTLGQPPTGDRLVEYLVALTRFENSGAPSLREAVAEVMGVPAERMIEEPETYDPDLDMCYGTAAERVYETSVDLVGALSARDFEATASEIESVVATVPVIGSEPEPTAVSELKDVLEFIATDLLARVEAARQETTNTVAALEGGYVPPGGSGAPTRGGADLLPTGRNFYTLDPRRVPSKAAWDVGQSIAEGVLERHREETGAYPEEIGVVAWGTPTVRTRGETVAQILALLGVEPARSTAGRVEGVEPIELAALGRPRIDVTTRISGLFRDAFPRVAGLVQEAVETVAALDEPPARNFVRKHYLEERATSVSGKGELETVLPRVFTTRPGGYGSGTNKAITTGEWDDGADLADVFVTWGGYAVDDAGDVAEAKDAFETRLSKIEATVKLEDTAEQDEFDSSDWYAFHGGFKRAVADRRGVEPVSYVGDASDPSRPKIYTNEEKLRRTMRTRVLNPDWIDSMQAHDYKGAGDLATTVEIALGWAATTDAISDTLWKEIAAEYALDEDRREWFLAENPWALEHITDRLLEAVDRDLWTADREIVDRLKDVQLTVDGELEAAPDGPEGRR
ncbi:cobaltochelatase subunit CobN [Halorhabdus amylolytica]|uniref:cobaltochelatase subunit CobN n=1 Tax=Halorhabdus amylolytica TaxID=2559573 RepID=UPI0010A9A6AE|nr:cobaltochelatase subunit CobN [Halorhabdus amylolytica]